jgi:type IV secretory pathway component VirB8
MRKRTKLTFSFEKKSNKDIQSGLIDTDKHIGLDKGRKMTMYVALISLISAVLKVGAVLLPFLLQ